MSAPDAWRRQFPTPALLDVVDAFATLVADRAADRVAERLGARPEVERAGFSPKEAAGYLGMGEATVRRLVESGAIKAGHLGGRVVIHRAELDRLMLGEVCAS
ncbi:MAG: Helix-turn-helix domain [Acidimicrobiales bacterium]|nr:Helix-turn-helix domain [Acidimicrobiales bacterium]